MLKLALIAVERFKHCLAAVQTASIGVNRPIPEARYQHGPSQDTSARNFIPQCDFTRYCNRTRDCSCNETTVCHGLWWSISHHLVERGVAFGSGCACRAVTAMMTEPQRTCPSCGNELSGTMESCPVCLLRKGLAGGVESGESSASEDPIKPTPEQAGQRFEHYKLVTGEDGKPVELGRGAMGVTYKAFDLDLHCPVTLEVINEKYLGDESTRLRFLREARAAASVRHPNVACVFQNREQLLLRDGIRRGRNAGEPYQTLRAA
jgi:hypothetical protein